MVGKSFMQSAALAVLAAVGAMSVPAQAQDRNQDRHEARAAMREARQAQRAERQQAAPQQAPVAHTWNRGGGDGQARAEARQQRPAPEGGWRSQRAAEGQRYGRNWDNNGAVSRPAPAINGATPQVPQRSYQQSRSYDGNRTPGQWSRNRTYSDPNRSVTYGSQTYNRGTQDWRSRQGDRRDQTRAYRQGYNGGYNSASRDYRRWNNNDWRRDNRYNWSSYRTQHRDLYRAGRYYSPYSNYRYNRLSIGFFLEPLFYGQNYWIDDPYQYRLPEAYGPYRWVRYYDDALLVDIYSGEVVDVINDFFW